MASGKNRFIGAPQFTAGRIGRQCSSGVLERGGGNPVVVDGRQMARPRGGESRLTAQQLGDGGQAGLVAVLDDAVRLFRFGRSSGGDFDPLRGCLQIQVRLAYLQVNRRIGAPPEGLGTGLGKARLLHAGPWSRPRSTSSSAA